MLVEEKGKYKLYIKGADSTMESVLTSYSEMPYLQKTKTCIDEFSKVGLRTLMFGCRIITEVQFQEIYQMFKDATRSQNKKEKLERLCRLVEREIVLLGCTAVEDKLQEKVHSSITRFYQAGIKVWMITGDKLQTAENIANSAGIFQSDMKILTLTDLTKDNFKNLVQDVKKKIQSISPGEKIGIVIDISQACKEGFTSFYTWKPFVLFCRPQKRHPNLPLHSDRCRFCGLRPCLPKTKG